MKGYKGKFDPDQKMAEHAAAIQQAIAAAKEFANKYDKSFDMAPAYGMGGTYYSPGALKRDLAYHDNSSPCQNEKYALVNQYEYYINLENGGWVTSSMEC